MKRFIIGAGIGLLCLYFVALGLIYIFQRSLHYFPPSENLSPSDVGIENVEVIPSQSKLGDTCQYWWIEPTDDTKPVIMFFHGNGSAIYQEHQIYKDIQANGYGVLAVSYPGYPGCAERKPTQDRIVAAATAQYDSLVDKGISQDRIVFYGTSIGSGVAAQLSARRRPALLILEAPFSSTLAIAKMRMPMFPVSKLMKDTFRSDLAIAGLGVPLVWLHGTHDSVIPFKSGRALFEGYDGPKTAYVLEGGYHTNLWDIGGRQMILSELDGL